MTGDIHGSVWLHPVSLERLREASLSIDFRRAAPRDHAATYDIVTQAMTDLLVRRHNLPFPRAPEIQPRDLAFRQYAYEFHRESYWMAEEAARQVGEEHSGTLLDIGQWGARVGQFDAGEKRWRGHPEHGCIGAVRNPLKEI